MIIIFTSMNFYLTRKMRRKIMTDFIETSHRRIRATKHPRKELKSIFKHTFY